MKIEALDEVILRRATKLGISDLEDAVQYVAALDFGADALIMRDIKGFPTRDRLPILTPTEWLGGFTEEAEG